MQNKQAMYALALGLMGFLATGDSAGVVRTAEAASPVEPVAPASIKRITSASVPSAAGVKKITVTTKQGPKTGSNAVTAMHAKMEALRKPAVLVAAPPVPVAAVLPAALPSAAPTKVAPVERRVSLDFVGADIVDVLKALSLQSGLNVVAGSDVKGPITVTLKNVPMLEALDMVTRLSGFRYAKVGSTYIVGTGASIAGLSRSASAQAAQSAAISFYYSDGATLEKSILQAFPNLNISRVDIGADAKANGGGLIPGGNLNGAPGANVIDPATGAVVQGAIPGSAASINQNSGSRFGPKGGVLNVVGTPDEIAAVRAFVDSTEEGLVTSARRQQDAENKVLAGLITETYKLKYASPSELTVIVNRLVPSLQVQAGPTQAFQPRTLNGSASFSSGPGTSSGGSGASPAANHGGQWRGWQYGYGNHGQHADYRPRRTVAFAADPAFDGNAVRH